MKSRRKMLLVCAVIICAIASVMIALTLGSTDPYPGMKRIASHTVHGNKTNGDHYVDLPGLKSGQLVVIEANLKSGATSSWIRHSSTDAFVLEGQGFEDGKLEYDVREDADYSFQLNCDNTEFDVSISVWEKTD